MMLIENCEFDISNDLEHFSLWNLTTDELILQKLLKTSANPKAAKKKKKAAEKVTKRVFVP